MASATAAIPREDAAAERPAAGSSTVLRIERVSMNFGGIQALTDLSFDVPEHEITALIGPNGAGKTTLFNVIGGIYPPSSGRVLYQTQDLSRLARHRVVTKGIARTFQNVAQCKTLSVLDNVLLGAHSQVRAGTVSAILGTKAYRQDTERLRARAFEIFDLLELQDVSQKKPGDLAFGTQKRVELARALMAEPSMLLLDEPANGLSHNEVGDLSVIILKLKEVFKLTMVLVEHHMEMVFRVADRVIVLDAGRLLAQGSKAEIRENPLVVEAYLGKKS